METIAEGQSIGGSASNFPWFAKNPNFELTLEGEDERMFIDNFNSLIFRKNNCKLKSVIENQNWTYT